jgi:hypothetical protein
MIDVSDGLAADARHLAAASGVGLEVAMERVPCALGADALGAVASGEEYELLVTLPGDFGVADAQAFQEFHDLPLTRVGDVVAGAGALHRPWRGGHAGRRVGPLRVIRTLCFYVTLVFATIVTGTTVLVASLVRVPFRRGGVYDWCTRAWGRWSLVGAGLPIDAQGLERVPPDRVVFAANHSSLFDILVLYAVLPGSVRFVAKQELARIPFFGTAMVRSGNVVIDRFHPRAAQEAYRRAAETMIAFQPQKLNQLRASLYMRALQRRCSE